MTSARIVADDGVSSDGLATTALPITSAGATLSDIINSGTFHGAIQAITPLGRRFVTYSPRIPPGRSMVLEGFSSDRPDRNRH